MDLDDLRHALDDAAARRAPRDVSEAGVRVHLRAQRRRRRQRGIASATMLVGAIAVIVVVLAIAGGGSSPHSPVVATQPPASYQSLPPRTNPAMAYDAAHGDVVLFGGAVGSETAVAETWLWDGHGWYQAHPTVSPPARADAVMAYDPQTRTVLLFGGLSVRPHVDTISRTDTWSWNGTTWRRLAPRHVPPWSSGLAMSYDPASKSVILLTLPSSHPDLELQTNGVSSRGTTRFGTWQWDGSDWHELSTPTAPTFASGAVFATRPRLTPLPGGRGLLFYSWAIFDGPCPAPCDQGPDPNGLVHTQTWTWDGHRWTEQHPTRAPTDAQMLVTVDGAPTAFNAISRWTWTNSDWVSARPAAGPFAEFGVYDTHDHDVVAYDGSATWTWDGRWVFRDGVRPKSTSSPVTSAVTTSTTGVSSTSTSTVAPVSACASTQLRVAFDNDLGSLMQQPGAYFAITNTSTTPCTLDGYPNVQLVDTAGHALATRQYDGSSYQINDPGAHAVTVTPGATVYFGIGWSDVNQPDGGTEKGCVYIGSASVVVPGSGHAFAVPARLGELYCPGGVSVTAIAPKRAFNPSSPA